MHARTHARMHAHTITRTHAQVVKELAIKPAEGEQSLVASLEPAKVRPIGSLNEAR